MKLASRQDCTGCMGCINACRHDVLDYKFDKSGYFKIVVKNINNCINCGLCSKTCPVVTPVDNPNKESLGWTAWNENHAQRKLSASGGVFSALATKILNEGGAVYGASIEKFSVKHIRIDDIRDLRRLQGTKYQLSITEDVFPNVRKDLIQGKRVLFTGMSCQISALNNYLGRIDKSNLYTIDTICGGHTSILPMKKLEESGQFSGIISFRDKDNGWKSKGFLYNLKMADNNGGPVSLGFNNIVTRTFATHLLKQSSCLNCKFNGVSRISDMTIGDFWGDTTFPDQHPQGLSCVVTHSQKGFELLKKCDITVKPTKIESIAKGNSNLYWSKYKYLRHSVSRLVALFCLRRNWYNTALKISSYSGIASLGWRIYTRINNRKRSKYFTSLKEIF